MQWYILYFRFKEEFHAISEIRKESFVSEVDVMSKVHPDKQYAIKIIPLPTW